MRFQISMQSDKNSEKDLQDRKEKKKNVRGMEKMKENTVCTLIQDWKPE